MNSAEISTKDGKKYRLIQQIGGGAFADVFKALDLEKNEIVAVKKMKVMSKQSKILIQNEIELMRKLNHKNVLQYKNDFIYQNRWYVILEYCGKGDLESFKNKVGKVPEQYCKTLIYGLTGALEYLHSIKIVHRDLKLANILINNDYKIKLADFGFSKDSEENFLVSFCGSPIAMAPEILQRKQYDDKCDVWSLGVLTYILLFNYAPYHPDPKKHGYGLVGITNAVLHEKHKFDMKVKISDECKSFLNNCLEKQPTKRKSMKQLMEHPWLQPIKFDASKIGAVFLQSSLSLECEAVDMCKTMLYSAFEEHLRKMVQLINLSEKSIRNIIDKMKKMYPKEERITNLILLMACKKLEEFSHLETIFVLMSNSHKIELRNIQKFQRYIEKIKSVIQVQQKQLPPFKEEKVNIEKQIISFIIKEGQYFFDNETDVYENRILKADLLKDICKFLKIKIGENNYVQIDWGYDPMLDKLQKKAQNFVKQASPNQIIDIINEQKTSEEDVQSLWLIAHSHEQCPRAGPQYEHLNIASYVLNIKSNFDDI